MYHPILDIECHTDDILDSTVRKKWFGNSTLQDMGFIEAPFEWLLYSQFSVVLAFVHLIPYGRSFQLMMRIDQSLKPHDAGATT